MSEATSDAPLPLFSSRSLAMIVHLSTCIGFFLSVSVVAGLIGPAVAWATAHRRNAYLSHNAREALNFHLSVLVYGLAIVSLPTPPSLAAVLVVTWMATVVVVAGMAYEGRPMRYPGALPILRRPRSASVG